MEANASQNANIKLMPGSSDGKYLAFARKGNVLLGVRRDGIHRGVNYGVPGTTYFTCRLRSAPENGLFAEEDAAKTVVKLVPNPTNLWDAWPGVTWEKKDESRASTTIGIFVEGALQGEGSESRDKVLAEIESGALIDKLTDYLVSVAGGDNLVIDALSIKVWLAGQYGPVLAAIKETLTQQAKFAELAKDSVGTVGMQAELLKKVYEATHPDEPKKGEEDEEGEKASQIDDEDDVD